MKLSIIIPLYNEVNTIIDVLNRICNIDFPDFLDAWEIIVVNDCSNDGSKEKVEVYLEGRKNISLLNHTVNQGKGKSIRTGADKMSGDVLLIQDADLEL